MVLFLYRVAKQSSGRCKVRLIHNQDFCMTLKDKFHAYLGLPPTDIFKDVVLFFGLSYEAWIILNWIGDIISEHTPF